MSEKLILIDGHSILNRAFYGMPDLTNSEGRHTGAVYGFLMILFRFLDEEHPDYLTVAFDRHEPTFRHDYYQDYKGTRHAMPDELREQVPLIKDVLHAMGVVTIEQPGLEADDLLGTLAKKAQAEGMDVALISGDRDLLQIADEHITIRIPKTRHGQTTVEDYNAAAVQETLGVTPQEFIEVKALQGDTSDNIPGVPKVGPKTATELIQTYHSVAGVYEHLDEITKKGLHDTLAANKELADMSLFLARIKTDADITLDKEHARIGNLYTQEAYALYNTLGFKRLLSRFSSETTAAAIETSEEVAFTCETLADRNAIETAFTAAQAAGKAAIYPVYDRSALGMADTLVGLAISYADRNLWIAVNGTDDGVPQGQMSLDMFLAPQGGSASAAAGEDVLSTAYLIEHLTTLRKSGAEIITYDLKNQYPFLGIEESELTDGIHLDNLRDLLIEAYLINPLKSDYQPEDIASEYLHANIEGARQFLGKETYAAKAAADDGKLADYACHVSSTLLRAAGPLQDRLTAEAMWDLYRTLELPISYVLYDMQRIGITVVPERLKDYGDQLVGRIGELDAAIHEAAGDPNVNISSPKQLGELLFERLNLPGGKKTKTGYSTAADILEPLAADHPIVADILEYRALTKLKSTYADGLAAYIASDSKIHTVFHQTITATGRLSSSDPNLQNIPMRTELGRAIRKVFVPAQAGWTFADADYSQIELRILASMSGDESLIEAFRENRDIHRTTASKVFHVPFDEVTSQQRRDAKAVNFGIVYGISSFGLSQNLSISRRQAQQYIDEYFTMFPGIKQFLDGLVASAKETGYSTTLFGRRRPIPELKNSNFMQRQFGERVAMNAPIQGTGADIMKIGMLHVWERLHREQLQSRLILQIHDELLIETAPGEEAQVQAILEEEMSNAATLAVNLDVDAHTGATDWFEAK